MAVIKIVPFPGPKGDPGAGGSDLVVPTYIKDADGDDFITFTRTSTNTARIATPQDDLSLRSARDITLFPGSDGAGNVYIGWGDAEYTPDSPNRVATIGDIESGTTGDITFDGVQIIGAGTASGDGQSNSTIEIVPDVDLYVNDQYLIIDPTNPNHIHIRAGGTQDESNADLILGGEKNNVYIEDDARQVSINTRPDTISNNYVNDNLTSSITFVTSNASDINIDYVVNVGGTDYLVDAVTSNSPTEGLLSVTASGAAFTAGNTYTFTYEPPYTNYWQFGSDGYLSGPAMGGLFVSGILNGENDLWLSSGESVVLNGNNGGEFIGNADDPENQIATIGDFGYLNIVSETDPQEGPYTTLEVPNNLVIQTYGNPGGEITIQSEKGVRFNYTPEVGGVYLNGNEEYPETQVATLGDVAAVTSEGATGSFVSNDGKTVTVTNGIITAIEVIP